MRAEAVPANNLSIYRSAGGSPARLTALTGTQGGQVSQALFGLQVRHLGGLLGNRLSESFIRWADLSWI